MVAYLSLALQVCDDFRMRMAQPYVYALRVLAFKTCLLPIENYETPS